MTHPISTPAEANLRMTDSFAVRVSPPAGGLLRTEIQLGSAPAVTLTLAAAHDMHTKPPFAIIGEEARQEWHIRGLRIAESIRSRLRFVYMQSWPLAELTPYFANDCGRVIFDERVIEEEA